MSPFMTFALVLTAAYAVYYGVVVARDLKGKKGRADSTEEVFDLEGMENEESVEVRETEGCFHVGGTDAEEDTARETDTHGESAGTPEGTPHHAAEEKAGRIKANLIEAEIESENGMTAPELYELLESKRQTLFKPEMTVTRDEI